MPIFVWAEYDNYILDGHQRLKALIEMRQDGYDIPMIPVAYIEAESEEEAREKLLQVTSQYGEFDLDGLTSFLEEVSAGFDIDTTRLVDGELYTGGTTSYDIPEDNKDIDEDEMADTKHECPSCGFKW